MLVHSQVDAMSSHVIASLVHLDVGGHPCACPPRPPTVQVPGCSSEQTGFQLCNAGMQASEGDI